MAGSYTDPAAKRETTYFILNSPVVSELYSRHGRDINFLGVVLYNSALTQHGGQVKTSSYAANLAEILGAQGAVLSGGSQSNLGIPLMLLCQKLERKGIKTVIITTERSDDPADSGLAHAVPEATAIVSTGNYYEKVSLPPMQKVIGGSKLLETNEDASGALNIMIHYLLDATDYNGFGKLFVKQY